LELDSLNPFLGTLYGTTSLTVGDPNEETVKLFELMSLNVVLAHVNKEVLVTGDNGAVGGVNEEEYKHVPFTTLRFEI
jgi:hypothetical protein